MPVSVQQNRRAQMMDDVDDDEWAAGVAAIEAAFKNLEKKGLIVACGQRWAERIGCMQTAYRIAPGITDKDWCDVPMALA
jgi:hypothetical protein